MIPLADYCRSTGTRVRKAPRCSEAFGIGVVMFLAVMLWSGVPGQAALITMEQSGDSLCFTVYDEGRPVERFAGQGTTFRTLAGLAAEAGVTFDSTGIVLRHLTVPWGAVSVSGRIRHPGTGWHIVLDTAVSGQAALDNRCRASSRLVVAKEEFLFGSLFSWNGPVEISGEISGDVICLGGSVKLLPGAVVRGSVMAQGGIVDQQAPAKVYGGIFSDQKHIYHRVDVSREWEYESDRYGLRPTFTYDKVDGARPGIKLFFQDTWMTPKIGFWSAYAVQSERWQYRLFFEQRLSAGRDIRLGGEYARFTDTEDKLFIYPLENTIVALLANEDYRDYFGRQGGRLWATAEVRERHTATIEYENYDYRWRDAAPKLWSLFWTGRDFRENFGVLDDMVDGLISLEHFERKVSLLRLSYRVSEPERDRYVTGLGYRGEGFWEIGGGALKGGWEYSRIFLRGAVWYDFAGRHHILLRAFGGKARHDVPAPKLFYLGGPASLRGYRVKQFVGDEAFLATVEYSIRFWKHAITDASLVLFYDIGRAALDGEFWVLQDFKSDVGVALDFGGGFRLAVAQALRESDLEPAVTLRVKAGL